MVAAILILSGIASGGLIGLVSAMIAAPLPEPSNNLVLILIASGVVLDAVRLLTGRPGPPASGKQVPQEWGRLLSPRIVAMLYGARLGVGPLTILSTWTWWSFTAAAALIGPATAVAVGATFGATRLLVTVGASLISPSPAATAGAASEAATARSHADWFGKLRTRRRPNWLAINGLGFLAVVTFAAAGCTSGSDQVTAPDTGTVSTTMPTTTTLASNTPTTRADLATTSTIGLPAIYSVELEDFVRTITPDAPEAETDAAQNPTEAAEPTVIQNVSSDPEDLEVALTSAIAGFEPVEDPLADRFLDIVAASELQPDPTEEIALLETRGFEGGWTRAFRNEQNDVAVASVYQFEDAGEAEFYLEDGLITIGGYGGKFFDIEGLPGVRGFVQYFNETDEDGTEELVSLGAAFQAGPRWYLVYFVGSPDSVTPEVLIPAIATQLQAA